MLDFPGHPGEMNVATAGFGAHVSGEWVLIEVENGRNISSRLCESLLVYLGDFALMMMCFFSSYDEVGSSAVASGRCPRGDRWALRVVWTGFSPLRCFLWAAFKAEFLHQIPTGTVEAKLQTALLELPGFRVWVRLSSVATHPYRRHALQVPPVSAVCFRLDVLCDAQRQRSGVGFFFCFLCL